MAKKKITNLNSHHGIPLTEEEPSEDIVKEVPKNPIEIFLFQIAWLPRGVPLCERTLLDQTVSAHVLRRLIHPFSWIR